MSFDPPDESVHSLAHSQSPLWASVRQIFQPDIQNHAPESEAVPAGEEYHHCQWPPEKASSPKLENHFCF